MYAFSWVLIYTLIVMLNTLELKASIENFSQLSNQWHDIAASWSLNNTLINKIDVCIEEIYVNIASYI